MASEDDSNKEYPCLVRVTDGDETKFSTQVSIHCLPQPAFRRITHLGACVRQVEPGQLESFHATYGALLKSSMTTLRKRDKKREKQRAEEIARRKRKLAEEIIVEGPKRGAGRRKRQRKLKAAAKQAEARKRVQEREEAKVREKE